MLCNCCICTETAEQDYMHQSDAIFSTATDLRDSLENQRRRETSELKQNASLLPVRVFAAIVSESSY